MKRKTPFVVLYVIGTFLITGLLSAQDSLSGTITYQQVLHYSFENIKQAHGDSQQTQDWMATLPTEGITVQILNFNGKNALFKEDDSEKEATPPGLQRALMYESSLKPPHPLVKQVYYDFQKNQKLQQVEYLTRFFLVQSKIPAPGWKLKSEKRKILEYTCMGASLNLVNEEIIAWFAPEIPVPIGPGIYGGLPGLILAVERNGETAYVATKVNFSPPTENELTKPDRGSEISEGEFVSLQEEKEKEWKENSKSQGGNYHR